MEGRPEQEKRETSHAFGTSLAAFFAGLGVAAIGAVIMAVGLWQLKWWIALPGLVVFVYAASAIKIAKQWEKVVVLRLGRFHRTVGPGPFIVIPLIESIAARVDQRIVTTAFSAEQTLTKDNVPVDVDAVLFWVVWDPERAALEVVDYREAVSWAAQTALREVIGRTLLSEMLAAREHIDQTLEKIIDARTEPWGIAVQAVEIRDVIIPPTLQEAMSREAQAERERRARVILGTAEVEIASKFAEASQAYRGNEVALQLRAMNLLYEGLKEKGGLIVVPSRAIESLGIGGTLALAALDRPDAASEAKPAGRLGEAPTGGTTGAEKTR